MSELSLLPVWALSKMVARREISPVELLEDALESIERFDGELHSYITVCADQSPDTGTGG